MDASHDPELKSWVESGNAADAPFPIQNLPLGVARSGERCQLVAAIGDRALPLGALADAAKFDAGLDAACRAPNLNPLMALGAEASLGLRLALSTALRAGAPAQSRLEPALLPLAGLAMTLPAAVGDYTDFYASIHHASRVGALFRPDAPLLPNYKWIPIGYHGRASSLVASGTEVRRPSGQRPPQPGSSPEFGPSRALDYEVEIAFWIGAGNRLAEPVPIDAAESHLFGLSLLNDWSARDLQRWEYQPLGPFLGKNFATSLSPWVVTWHALAPFRAPAAPRPADDPAPLAYLSAAADQAAGAIKAELEVWIETAKMRQAGLPPHRLSVCDLETLYWTPAQLLTHHTSNGCNLRPGDLLASGTVSGPDPASAGCLLELTAGGAQPLTLPGGESRRYLEDGDEIILRGACRRPGFRSIGLGECRGRITSQK